MTEEVIEAKEVAQIEEPKAASSELTALKEQLKNMEQKMNFLNEQLLKANSDIAQRDVDLAKYKKDAEKRAKDDAWATQSKRLPEAHRTAEMRTLFETDKDAYLDKVVTILTTGGNSVAVEKASGSVMSSKTEVTTSDENDICGYFFSD